MEIYLLRHANAGEQKLNPAKDEKRPLDKLGIEQSHDVGRALAAMNISVDAIISSPLRRATQTAAVVANEIGHEEKVLTDPALRPGATYEQFQELLRRHSRKDAILVVGHNPTMTGARAWSSRKARSPKWKKMGAGRLFSNGVCRRRWCAQFSKPRPAARARRRFRSNSFPARPPTIPAQFLPQAAAPAAGARGRPDECAL